jgi:ssDNA-binding Zn-finger/Zn-ribbon topoisomerase 1
MVLRESRYGLMYGCSQYPQCRGTHGAHADGAPLGRPADGETKKLRIRAHELFDQLWKPGLHPGIASLVNRFENDRQTAYRWLQQSMNLTRDQAHIGNFDKAECEALIRHLKKLGLKEEDGENLETDLLQHNGKYGLLQSGDFDPLLNPCWVVVQEGEFAGRTGWCFNLEGPDFPGGGCTEPCREITFQQDPGSHFIPLRWLEKKDPG